MEKRGRKVDNTRHLCKACKKLHDNCVNENYKTGESDNVFKCDGYKKTDVNKLRWRASVGGEYYVIILRNDKASMKDFIPHKRVENETRIDSLYHEIGNYFETIGECEKEIIRWNGL